MRQADLDDFRPGGLHPVDALLPQRIDFRAHRIGAVFLRDADFQPTDIAGQRRFEIRHRHIDAGAVFGIESGHSLQHNRGITHAAGHRSRLIEAGRKGDDTPP